MDTAFQGALTLPQAAITALNLPYQIDFHTRLANGTVFVAPVYTATIVFDGQEMQIPVLAMGTRPLIGTLLLDSKRLCVDFEENGNVTIEDLP